MPHFGRMRLWVGQPCEFLGVRVLGKSTCADNLITTYLTTLKAPADGSACTQNRASRSTRLLKGRQY